MKFSPRFRLITVIVISTLVLIISAVTLIGVWTIQGKVSSAAVAVLRGLDQSAQVLSSGIAGIDTGLVKVEETTGKIETTSSQIAQQVSDQGVALALLPELWEQELTTTVKSVQEIFSSIEALLNTIYDTMRAFDNLPFIEAPAKGLSAVSKLQGEMEQLAALADDFRADIRAFRLATATGITRVTTTANNLNMKVYDIRNELDLIDGELQRIQVQSKRFQEQLPVLLFFFSVLITFLTTWVGYEQIVIINRAIRSYRLIPPNEGVRG
jgi:hypothetical protein